MLLISGIGMLGIGMHWAWDWACLGLGCRCTFRAGLKRAHTGAGPTHAVVRCKSSQISRVGHLSLAPRTSSGSKILWWIEVTACLGYPRQVVLAG